MVLAFVFVFGNNVRQMYESVFLLFIVHPFDVGDCLLVQEAWHTVGLAAFSCHDSQLLLLLPAGDCLPDTMFASCLPPAWLLRV